MEVTLGVTPPNGSDIIMQDLGYRFARGGRLTFAEQGMAMMATAAMNADRFGPSPKDMQLQPASLPETVKGALAQFSV